MIQFWFIVTMFLIIAITDCLLEKSELTFRDNLKEGATAIVEKAGRLSSYAKFGIWYLLMAFILYYMPICWEAKIVTFSITAILQLCFGMEDAIFYLVEPLIKLPRRDERYKVKFWIWRFPEDLHWLGAGDNEGHTGWHNPVLMFFCGDRIASEPFLIVVSIANLIVFIASLLWK